MKKTIQIGVRITEECYNKLEDYAKKQKWSMAFTASEILEQYLSAFGAVVQSGADKQAPPLHSANHTDLAHTAD